MAPRNRSSKPRGKALTKQAFVQMLNARREMKYNTQNSETNMPVNGSINTMTQAIIVGDTADSRDGNQISVKNIDIKLSMFLNASVNIDFVRFIVFVDQQSNGVYPTVGDILVATDPNAVYTRSVVVTKRFKILRDKTFTLTTGGDNRAIFYSKKLHLGNHTVTYGGTTSVESSNGRGAVYFLLCGDEATNFTAYNIDWGVTFFDS
jgi:hypothetical protein